MLSNKIISIYKTYLFDYSKANLSESEIIFIILIYTYDKDKIKIDTNQISKKINWEQNKIMQTIQSLKEKEIIETEFKKTKGKLTEYILVDKIDKNFSSKIKNELLRTKKAKILTSILAKFEISPSDELDYYIDKIIKLKINDEKLDDLLTKIKFKKKYKNIDEIYEFLEDYNKFNKIT